MNKLLSIALSLLGLIPLSMARGLGSVFGYVPILFNTRSRRFTLANLSAVYPEKDSNEINGLVKASLCETAKLALEMNIIWRRDARYLSTVILNVHNEALMHKAVEKQKGVIILAPHLGNWEVLGKHLPTYGSVTNLYKPPKQKAFEEFVKRSREESGAQLVPTSTRGVATLLKRLKNGGITGILPDQVPDSGSGEFAEFFGLAAYTPTLIHGLLQRTQCTALVSFAKRVPKGFEIHFIEPHPDLYSKDLKTSLSGLNKSIEEIIKLAPTQYQWEYKRFKKQLPDGSHAVDYSAKLS